VVVVAAHRAMDLTPLLTVLEPLDDLTTATAFLAHAP
jgi:hypothetical protein